MKTSLTPSGDAPSPHNNHSPSLFPWQQNTEEEEIIINTIIQLQQQEYNNNNRRIYSLFKSPHIRPRTLLLGRH